MRIGFLGTSAELPAESFTWLKATLENYLVWQMSENVKNDRPTHILVGLQRTTGVIAGAMAMAYGIEYSVHEPRRMHNKGEPYDTIREHAKYYVSRTLAGAPINGHTFTLYAKRLIIASHRLVIVLRRGGPTAHYFRLALTKHVTTRIYLIDLDNFTAGWVDR